MRARSRGSSGEQVVHLEELPLLGRQRARSGCFELGDPLAALS
jgi:hypothetical protein